MALAIFSLSNLNKEKKIPKFFVLKGGDNIKIKTHKTLDLTFGNFWSVFPACLFGCQVDWTV